MMQRQTAHSSNTSKLGRNTRALIPLLISGLALSACTQQLFSLSSLDALGPKGGASGTFFGNSSQPEDQIAVVGRASPVVNSANPVPSSATVVDSSATLTSSPYVLPSTDAGTEAQANPNDSAGVVVPQASVAEMLGASELTPRHDAGSPQLLPTTAQGYYNYLVDAGFRVSSPSPIDETQGATHALSFVLDEGGHGHRIRVYEFSNEDDARALHAAFDTHRLAAVCGTLVVSPDFPIPGGQMVGKFENALDIYVAKAQHGLIGENREVALAENSSQGREPVRAVRKMFMLSRDSVVYSDPTTASPAIATLQEDSYIRVIDLLPNFLKVRLGSGEIGFLPERSVE